jgi:pimeloyl-ACP methyl ester carboxylesterase
LVETVAEMSFDSRSELPRIDIPVVLVCGDRDRFFPEDLVVETALLIPGSSLVWYQG